MGSGIWDLGSGIWGRIAVEWLRMGTFHIGSDIESDMGSDIESDIAFPTCWCCNTNIRAIQLLHSARECFFSPSLTVVAMGIVAQH
jgi:hypothetical protein